MMAEPREVSAFGKELPEQSIGVFVCTTLPSTVRLGEVDFQPQQSGELFMLSELLAVVEGGSTAEVPRQLAQPSSRGLNHGFGLQAIHLGRTEVTRLPVHGGQHSTPPAFAHDRIAFPVAVASPLVHDPRAPLDRDATGDPSAFCGSQPTAAAPQTSLPVAAVFLPLDPIVNRLVRELPCRLSQKLLSRATRDLIRRPVQLQAALHVLVHVGIVHLVRAAAFQSPFVRFALSLFGAITAPARVSLYFPANGASMSPEHLSNFRLGFPFLPQPI